MSSRVHTLLIIIFLSTSLCLALNRPGATHPINEKAKSPNILLAIADDWSYPHAGAYGDRVVKTPTFDRLAREGALLTNAYCASPSCTPSRAALLTGRYPHQLEEGGNLWSSLSSRYAVYPDLLEKAGFTVGFTRKGWGPGNFEAGERSRNPAGNQFKSFEEFFGQLPADKPFCFWFGSQDPHRPYDKDTGLRAGLKPEDVTVPPYWPDTTEVRNDILDYYFEVERFDRELGQIIAILEKAGQLDNTLIVVTSDNGMPFPRAKTNLYDAGTRMPMAIRWPAKLKPGKVIDAFASHTDLAPTFLEAAGIKPPAEMGGRSLLPLLEGKKQSGREMVFVERERHANVRRGDLGYPMRAARTKQYLYVRNFRPEREPAGDPELYHSVGPYGDIDDSPTKQLLMAQRDNRQIVKFFNLSFGKRPAEELYDLSKDPGQINNLVGKAEYEKARRQMRVMLDSWMKRTGDPRSVNPNDDRWDKYRYFGPPVAKEK